MNAENTINVRTVILASMMMLVAVAVLVSPVMASDSTDDAKDIYVNAGASFEYDGIPASMPGYDIVHWEVVGDLADSFRYTNGVLKGTVPSDLSTGEYTLALECIGTKYYNGTPSETVKTIGFLFHVTALGHTYAGDDDDLPSVRNVTVSGVGNNGLYAMITVETENTDSITFDFNDGTVMEPINLIGDVISSAHWFPHNGSYAITITVANEYGSTQKIYVYDGNGIPNEYAEPSETHKDTTFFYVALALTIILAVVSLYTHHPYAVVTAVVLAMVTVALYVW